VHWTRSRKPPPPITIYASSMISFPISWIVRWCKILSVNFPLLFEPHAAEPLAELGGVGTGGSGGTEFPREEGVARGRS